VVERFKHGFLDRFLRGVVEFAFVAAEQRYLRLEIERGLSLEFVGWTGALWGVIELMVVWYFFSAWNEKRKQVGVLKV
jgi:hypothetical protein